MAGFFSKVFGSGQGKETEIELHYLPMLIEKEFDLRNKDLEEFVAKKIAELKYLHSRCTALLKEISEKELEAKPNERFNKAALTSKTQLENQLEKLLQKIDPSTIEFSFDNIKAFAQEKYSLLLNEVMSFRKNISYTSFYLKDEMRTLGESLQEMLDKLNEINTRFAKEKDLFEFDKIKQSIGEIENQKELLKKLSEDEASALDDIKGQSAALERQKQKIDELMNGEKMKELVELKEKRVTLASQRQEMKTEVMSLLNTIDRPLQRFKSLVDSNRWTITKPQQDFLNTLTINPMIALKSDPKAETFKEIIVEIRAAIDDNKIDLKEKEKEKRLNALNEIMAFDFFGEIFWKLNENQKQQLDMDKKLEESPVQKALINEEQKSHDIDKKIQELKQKVESLGKEKLRIEEDIKKLVAEAKVFAELVLKKSITIKED